MRVFIAGLFLFSMLLAGTANQVQAQVEEITETAISVTPAIIDVAVKRSQTYSQKISISNVGANSLPISFDVRSLFTDQEIPKAYKSRYDASSWIKLSSDSGLFAPDQSKLLDFEITVPDNAPPGGHYATIVLQALSIESDNAIVTPEVTVTILITVAGSLKQSVEVTSSSIFPFYGTPGGLNSSGFKVTNTGNVHQIIAPELVFTHYGEEKVVRRLAPQLILPGMSKTFDEEWALPDKRGGYKAVMRLRYGDSRKLEIISAPENVVVGFPLAGLSLLLILTWGGVYVVRRHRNIHSAYKALLHG